MKTFLESKLPVLSPEECLFHIIPAPYEKIVAYAGGAGKGPAAILDARKPLMESAVRVRMASIRTKRNTARIFWSANFPMSGNQTKFRCCSAANKALRFPP